MAPRPDGPSRAAVVALIVVAAVVGWIAYLALRSAGPAVCVPVIAALSTLVLSFARLLHPRRGPDDDQ